MSWAVFPLRFVAAGVGVADIGLIKALYPAVWGVGQLVTGVLADRLGHKPLVVGGMAVQAAGHAVIGFGLAQPLVAGLVGAVLLRAGTALVYPALLAAVGDAAHPSWRAGAVGVYRTWRDLGYAAGALTGGAVAAVLDLVWAVHVAGLPTPSSGLLAARIMTETRPHQQLGPSRPPPGQPAWRARTRSRPSRSTSSPKRNWASKSQSSSARTTASAAASDPS